MDKLTDTAKQLLEKPSFAVVSTINPDGTPQQTVVWYELQGDRIMMNTVVGRLKDRNLRRDPRMSFCVSDGYHFVTLKGSVEMDEDPERALADIRRLSHRYKGEEEGEKSFTNIYGKHKRVTFYLPITDVYEYLD
jgi:PPOX class probable F420-dependent enzyme